MVSYVDEVKGFSVDRLIADLSNASVGLAGMVYTTETKNDWNELAGRRDVLIAELKSRVEG
jgi:hypothetical protein